MLVHRSMNGQTEYKLDRGYTRHVARPLQYRQPAEAVTTDRQQSAVRRSQGLFSPRPRSGPGQKEYSDPKIFKSSHQGLQETPV